MKYRKSPVKMPKKKVAEPAFSKNIKGAYRFLKRVPLLGLVLRVLRRHFINLKKRRLQINLCLNSKTPSLIAVTHPNYRGVNSATKEIATDVIEVSEIFTRRKAKKVAKIILSYVPQKVLISGYAIGYDLLAEELKKMEPNLRLFVLIHSPFIWFDVRPNENQVFEGFLSLAKKGLIEKVGFCKKDLAEYFKILGYNSYFVMNRFYPERHSFKKLSKNNLKIGIWGTNFWHRNITNQTAAALMIPRAKIHVNEIGKHNFLDQKRIKIHGILPKKNFLNLIQKMDINLYVSFTDCFPMTLIESMQYGVPAIASDTSDVYAFNKSLHAKLTVSTVDGPLGIKEKILEVLDDYDNIQKEIKAYLPALKKETEKSIKEFLK